MIKYTDEMRQFFAEYIPGHHHKETAEEFTRRFGIDITAKSINSYAKRYGIKTGFTGYFGKENAGFRCPKGYRIPGSEKGWFAKGNVPPNYRPVGSERITKDGYIEVKVADPGVWKAKHIIVWEEHHGKFDSKKYKIMFRDNNKLNCSIENLTQITYGELLKLNQLGLHNCDEQLKDTALLLARLSLAKGKAKRRNEKANR